MKQRHLPCHVCGRINGCKRKVGTYGNYDCQGVFHSLDPEHTPPQFKPMDIVLLKYGSAAVICKTNDYREGGHEVSYSVEYIKGLENPKDGMKTAWHYQSELTFLDSVSDIFGRALR